MSEPGNNGCNWAFLSLLGPSEPRYNLHHAVIQIFPSMIKIHDQNERNWETVERCILLSLHCSDAVIVLNVFKNAANDFIIPSCGPKRWLQFCHSGWAGLGWLTTGSNVTDWSREKLSRNGVQIYLRNQAFAVNLKNVAILYLQYAGTVTATLLARSKPINLINDMRLKYSNLQLHRQHY